MRGLQETKISPRVPIYISEGVLERERERERESKREREKRESWCKDQHLWALNAMGIRPQEGKDLKW